MVNGPSTIYVERGGRKALSGVKFESDALRRLETMALYAGLQLPAWAIRQQIASGLDLVVQHEQLEDGTRKITSITQVCALEGDRIVLRDLFVYDVEGRDERQRFCGRLRALGKPIFLDRRKKRGVTFPGDLFLFT